MLERRVTLINELGLHARAAAQVVREARKYKSRVTLRRDDKAVEADAGSILDILYLAAGRGKDVTLGADGEDAMAALDAIEKLFLDGFGEI
ncbi:MAG TPA: HPr family phosphocarrier protein [Pyrinomonadaceae bacterium]|jgi:phosphotransferase system HPr (HPr) family protein|nr:HPr family phosphocarrier protein [Pyrinomonadaceae bacterium]